MTSEKGPRDSTQEALCRAFVSALDSLERHGTSLISVEAGQNLVVLDVEGEAPDEPWVLAWPCLCVCVCVCSMAGW